MKELAQEQQWISPVLAGNHAGDAAELFVINLCASMTPMPSLPKHLDGFENYRLYQISRQEDGRRRYRLRLGFFTSEADAEIAVSAIRSLYPAAFTGCVTHEDHRFLSESRPAPSIAPVAPAHEPQPPQVVAPHALQQDTTPVAAQPAPARAIQPLAVSRPANGTVPAAKPMASAPVAASTIAQPAVTATPAATTPPTARSSTPAANATRSNDADMTVRQPALKLHDATPQAQQPTANPSSTVASTAPSMKAPPAPVSKPIVAASIVSPANPQRAIPGLNGNAPKIVNDFIPTLDSTLTIRTLTTAEAEDPNKPKWFVVQLALSEQPVNLDAMPKLDIFAAYSLYCVALMESGTIRHALRLGFFREKVSAEAVMGYLKTFFNDPTISQVSTSEYGRFADSKPVKPAPAPENVVPLENKRAPATPPAAARPQASTPTATSLRPSTTKPSVSSKTTISRQPSFLSRLIGRQLD